MTKTIEYIDLLIKEHKILKGDNQLFEDGYIEECIQTLEQIKCELEAWEVVNKHLILDKEFHQIDLHLHHDTIYKEDYLKLKKALEGKNE